jgi:NAD+ diphosphatase
VSSSDNDFEALLFRLASISPDTHEGSLHIVFQGDSLITDMRSATPCLIPHDMVKIQGWEVERRQFLGYWNDQACFGIEIASRAPLDAMAFQKGSLYQVLGRVEDQLFSLVGRAAQLLGWERDHRFCGRCGTPMELDTVERAMTCKPCSMVLYPRIAPCIIVLITRGEEMLLARSPNFPVPMYSTLAGFIEAGETAEQTLIREVREEVNLEVANIRYFRSQAWPFPNQLMLGYFADYAGGDIICDPIEIMDAQWFHHTDLPTIPPRASISGQLIHHHIESLS